MKETEAGKSHYRAYTGHRNAGSVLFGLSVFSKVFFGLSALSTVKVRHHTYAGNLNEVRICSYPGCGCVMHGAQTKCVPIDTYGCQASSEDKICTFAGCNRVMHGTQMKCVPGNTNGCQSSLKVKIYKTDGCNRVMDGACNTCRKGLGCRA